MKKLSFLLFFVCFALQTKAQQITTATPFLLISSDARAGGMGDVGVATSADAFSIFHNPAKTVFNENKISIGLNYTPWLRNLTDDIFVGNASYVNRFKENAAWGVDINWILSMPRERPRKSDDIARWATSVTAQKGNVVGMSIVGREDAQPIAQFKKAFATAEKKGLPRITHMFSYPDADSFDGVMEIVMPNRITDAWGVLDDSDAVSYLVEHDIPVIVTPTREVKLGRIKSVAEYPISEMLDNGLNLMIGSGMPAYFETSLTDEYVRLAEAGVSLAEIQLLIRNSIRASFMPDDTKSDLMVEFEQAIIELQE